MRRLLLSAAVLALLAADTAVAAPGKPALFGSGLVRPDSDSDVNTTGAVPITFGWREVTFDGGGPWTYQLIAHAGCCTNSLAPEVSATGDTGSDKTVTIYLEEGAWSVRVVAKQNGSFTESDSVGFTIDATGPTASNFFAPPVGRPWYRTLNIPVSAFAAHPTDAWKWQVDTVLGGWYCTNNTEPACPQSTFTNGPLQQGSGTTELSTPDGVKYVFVRFRDDVPYTITSRSPPLFSPKVRGNPGPGIYREVGLDTKPPVAVMARSIINGVAGQPVTLDAHPSYDQGAVDEKSTINRNNFEWRFGDRSGIKTGQPQSIQHTYPGPGTYDGIVIARDFAGTPSNPNDVNFGATTFKVNIAPAPVDETPGGGETPPPPPPPEGETPAGGDGAPPPQQIVEPPLDPLPDIPLVGLPQTAKKKTGRIAEMEAPSSVEPGEPIPIELKLRKPTRVKLSLRRQGKIVAQKTTARRRGTITTAMKAPKTPGTYGLVAKAGEKSLRLPVLVASAG